MSSVKEIKRMDSKDSIIAKNLTFESVAKVLEKIATTRTSRQKLVQLNKFFTFVRQQFKSHYGTLDSYRADGDSIYCVVRIFLPVQDRDRAAYGMKAPTLAKVFYDILGVGSSTKDAERLLNFKESDKEHGDFPTIVADVIRSRGIQPSYKPTLSDLHLCLDRLEKLGWKRNLDSKPEGLTLSDQKKEMQRFVLNLTPLEGKWFTLILLKQLGLGLSSGQIMAEVHEKAGAYYSQNRNLHTVCLTLNDPNAKLDAQAVEMFIPFKQMLCARLNLLDIGTGRTDENPRNTLTLPQPPFIIETKADGERFEIHYDASREEGNQFRLFGRSGVDYTIQFVQTLIPRLKARMKSGCKSVMLDGEMMMYQRSTRSFCQKGGRIDVRNLSPDDHDLQPAFVAFDIVYFNGEILTGLPIEERLEILDKKVFEPLEGCVYVSKRTVARTKEQVEEALNEAVGNCEEGLVVKEFGSVYKIGKRVTQWLKIKPELVDSTMVEDMDLIILGGFYTRSFKERGVTRFLVGLLDDSKPAGKEVFYPICTVGQGKLTAKELHDLVKELEPKFIKRDNPTFKINWKTGGRPDYLINPKKSVVLQVKAAEIVWSDTFELNYTLRFARTIRIRRDKTWREITTLKEFHDIRITTGGKLAKRSDNLPKEPGKVEFYVPPSRKKNAQPEKYEEYDLSSDEKDNYSPKAKVPRVYEKKKKQTIDFHDPDEELPKLPKATEVKPEPELAIPHSRKQPSHLHRPSAGFEDEQPVAALLNIPDPANVVDEKLPRLLPKAKPLLKKSSAHAQQARSTKLDPYYHQKLAKKELPKLTDTFQENTFYLVGTEEWKQKTGNLILQHGGHVVGNLTDADKLYAVIAESLTKRAQDVGTNNKMDVLKTSWVQRCVAQKKILAIQHDDCYISSPETQKELSKNYDKYGNSYKDPITVHGMKKLLEDVANRLDAEEEQGKGKCLKELVDFREHPELKKLSVYDCLKDCKVAFRGGSNTEVFIYGARIRFYGGRIAGNERERGVTHVVSFDPENDVARRLIQQRRRALSLTEHPEQEPMIVDPRWLEDSVRRASLQNEIQYTPEAA